MGPNLMISLVNNASLLLVLSVIYEIGYLVPQRFQRYRPVIKGLLVALVCLVIMTVPYNLRPGLFFDTRSILISITALFFGLIPALIAATSAIIYRVIIGGSGVLTGIAVITSSMLIGLVWRRWFYNSAIRWRWLSIYSMSLIVHGVMLASMVFVQSSDKLAVVREIAIPVMMIYPITSILLGVLLVHQEDRRISQEKLHDSEDKYRRLFETMAQGVVYQDSDGSIISANSAAEHILGLTLDQMKGKTSMDPGWQSLQEDGSPMPGSEHPAMIAIETGKPVGPIIMGVYQPQIAEHVWISINAIPLFRSGESAPYQVYTTFQDITGERKANQNYQLLFNKMVDAFALHRIISNDQGIPVDYQFLAVNHAFEKMTGLNSLDILGKTVREVMPGTEPYWIDKYGQVALTGEPISFGNYSAALGKYFEVSAYQPAPNQFACTFIDVTDRELALEALKQSEAKFRNYIENAPDGIFVIDNHGQYIEVNNAASDITGYSKDQLLGMTIQDITAKESLEDALKHFQTLLDTGSMNAELSYRHSDGRSRWWTVDAVKLSDSRYLGFSSDITDQKLSKDELIFIGSHDYLTGLYNRRCFEEKLVSIDCADELPLSIIVGDINGLKLINDTFGRAEGDKIIKATAELFRSCCRESDILARSSGDEFYLLLPKTDRLAANQIMEKIKSACQMMNVLIDNDFFKLNISMGFETKEKLDSDFSQVMKSAEDYMYQRKLLESRSSHSAIISSIKATLLEKSHETKEHADRLVELSRKIGMSLGLSQIELDNLELLSLLHDIGKVGVPDDILKKPGKLTDAEWIEMKKHSDVGYRIATSSPELSPIAEFILCHHERWDGKGYPQKLAGQDIPLLSRILAVVDSFDAMTENRPYRKAMTPDDAFAEIRRCAGTQFDPSIAQIFMQCQGVMSN